MLTLEQLRAIMSSLPKDKAEKYLPFLNSAMQEANINTPLRQAAFLAQIAHESVELSRLTENLNYSAQGLTKTLKKQFPSLESTLGYKNNPQKIANKVYANRYGNGSEASGDGWKYRGRGFIQLTFKDNYSAASYSLGYELITNPDLASQPDIAFRIAGWFWSRAKLNPLADAGLIEQIGQIINGGNHGKAQRLAYYQKALKTLNNQ
jgi:putative chitinase